jgi:ribonuclease PH
MEKKFFREGRAGDQIRPLTVTYNAFGYADASVLFEQGGTRVLVGVMMQDGVPHFLKGKGAGWLTAEYALLPISTRERTVRESSKMQRNSRNVEISRLIGRCLRSMIDFSVLGERTIMIDCDVLQADGGTRCACISAASLALLAASAVWVNRRVCNVVKEPIAAISVGLVDGKACLDLTQVEDNMAEADFNFVLTQSGKIIEIQGTSEKAPVSWEQFDQLKEFAMQGVQQVFQQAFKGAVQTREVTPRETLFSLGNRIKDA